MAVKQDLDMGIEKSYTMFLCSGGKIYVYKVSPDVSLSNHTWLSLIEFAVELRERVEVRAMATQLGLSLIA